MLRAVLLLAAAGCSTYSGEARDFSPARLGSETGWIAARGVPLERQHEEADCGAAAIAMVVAFWTGGDPDRIAGELRPAPKRGITAGRLRDLARRRGLAAFLVRGEVGDLERELRAGRPVLVGLVKPNGKRALTHYEVVVAMHRERKLIVTLDPALGWRQNRVEPFLREWAPSRRLALVVSARPPTSAESSADAAHPPTSSP